MTASEKGKEKFRPIDFEEKEIENYCAAMQVLRKMCNVNKLSLGERAAMELIQGLEKLKKFIEGSK